MPGLLIITLRPKRNEKMGGEKKVGKEKKFEKNEKKIISKGGRLEGGRRVPTVPRAYGYAGLPRVKPLSGALKEEERFRNASNQRNQVEKNQPCATSKRTLEKQNSHWERLKTGEGHGGSPG